MRNGKTAMLNISKIYEYTFKIIWHHWLKCLFIKHFNTSDIWLILKLSGLNWKAKLNVVQIITKFNASEENPTVVEIKIAARATMNNV